ncbi:MFS transporter [Campylobacter sp. MIT 97-5078]|uniref:MFS transporter n=1 Tax=Campylobacter sp. MIT 97-5078 TaxID=1548153 RepID=UPI0005132187|nr:MFS transporter [Campylobacter sp. MIT 97-5078]KGI56462.1 MFS transporter [Campylobacter sp. MIT 97-5078]TQR28018.1 MFS transporter [Campylobacter sp. MIT 97-5078]
MKYVNSIKLELVCKKISWRILPLIVLMFCLSMLDRTNISFIKSYIEIDASISEAAYALGAGIFFIGYALFEVPSNLLLHKLGAKIWLSRIMITWGLVTMAMIFIQGETSFYILRFLLGLTEAGFSPGIILYLSYFFPAIHRSKAYGIYQMGVPIAFVFGSLISGFILDYAPNIYFKNWQWMFLIEGGITVLVGIFCLFYLDSHPKDAKYLDAKEKDILLKHIENSNVKAQDHSIKDVFKSILVWKFVFVYFCIQLSVYGVLFYLPSKIAQILEINVGFKIGFLNAIPWIFVFIALPIFTSLADKKRSWNLYAILFLLLASLSMIASTFVTNLALFLFFISLATIGFIVIQPIFWNLPTQVLKGKGAAAAIALIGSLGNLGGFVAPTLKTYIESHFGVEFGLIVLALIAILGVLVLMHLKTTLNLDKGE